MENLDNHLDNLYGGVNEPEEDEREPEDYEPDYDLMAKDEDLELD